MKLTTDTSKDTLSSAQVESTSFTCEASPQMFQILTDKIYSDPISSLIRELISNAHDSHVEAKNTATPIDIKVPNELEPTFAVRDYGVSMSDEDIKRTYTVFFKSSKNDSNDQIGGFGLGAKLPFAYTDQFTVTTFLNNQKTVYLACKENSLPVLKKVLTTPSNEPRGVLIEVPVKEGDQYTFVRALSDFSKYSTFNMKYSDESIRKNAMVNTDLQLFLDQFNPNIKLYNNSNRYDSELIIRLGGVAYDLGDGRRQLFNSFNLAHRIERKISSKIGVRDWDVLSIEDGTSVVVDFPVGSLQPTASRESLQLTDHDKNKITYEIESLRVRLFKYIKSEFDKISTPDENSNRCVNSLADWIEFNKKFGRIDQCLRLRTSNGHSYVKINGEKVSVGLLSSKDINMNKYPMEEMRNCRILFRKNGKVKQSTTAEVFFDSPYSLFVTKLPISHIVESNLSERLLKSNSDQFCIVQIKNKVEMQEFIDKLKSKLGDLTLLFNIQELPADFETYREKVEHVSSGPRIKKDEKIEKFKNDYAESIKKWGKILTADSDSCPDCITRFLSYEEEQYYLVTCKRDREYATKHPELFEFVTFEHPVITSRRREMGRAWAAYVLFSYYNVRPFIERFKDHIPNKKLVQLYEEYDKKTGKYERMANVYSRIANKPMSYSDKKLIKLLPKDLVVMYLLYSDGSYRKLKEALGNTTIQLDLSKF